MAEYVEIDPSRREVIIHNIGIDRLKNRIDEKFTATSGYKQIKGSNIQGLFKSMKYLNWIQTEIKFYEFFSLEIYEMFVILADEYKDKKYAQVADEIYHKTWISNYESKDKIKTDLTGLSVFNSKYTPKDFQLEFIKNYQSLKFAYDLEGYILSFEQGLGKTFTSLAIAECLHKEIIYIICPNAVKENWAYEIKQYYRKYNNNDQLWKDEVYVSGIQKYSYNKNTTKFLIVNQESIPNLFPMVNNKKDSMIIVDESQNFRGLYTQRTAAMLELKRKANCHDNLLMSGTPIKAAAAELTPALRMIDPYFTDKLADIYYKTFTESSTEISNIVKVRFGRCIYRKLKKDVLTLPEKFISELKFKVPHEEDYSITKIRKEMIEMFHNEYIKRLKSGLFTTNKQSPFYRSIAPGYDFIEEKVKFENVVRKYSRAHKTATNDYLRFIFQESEDNKFELVTAQNVERKYFDFLNKYVVPYVKTSEEKEIVTKRFNGIFGWAVCAKSSAGTAIGILLAKYKNQCFTTIWRYHYQEFLDMIIKNKKKTIIFTALVPTADFIADDLNKKGIPTIEITGAAASGRMDLVNKFKNDDSIRCLVATTQTLANGVTLIEANQVLFFGTPYRSADFEQACDRIHRIGQTESCYIYNILLQSKDKNITDRIEEIMNWSEEMFDSLLLTENDTSEIQWYLKQNKK